MHFWILVWLIYTVANVDMFLFGIVFVHLYYPLFINQEFKYVATLSGCAAAFWNFMGLLVVGGNNVFQVSNFHKLNKQ